MRILANYGVKTNGDSHMVTFETTGDVPSDKAPETADELFRLAKDAVQRQVNRVSHPESSVTVQPASLPEEHSRNGSEAPSLATPRQVGLIRKLAREMGAYIEDPETLTKAQASQQIKALMAEKF